MTEVTIEMIKLRYNQTIFLSGSATQKWLQGLNQSLGHKDGPAYNQKPIWVLTFT